MELWMVGLALAALLVVSARDVGRPGRASAEGLLGLRAIGGLGLGAMAVMAVGSGHPIAAVVAGLGAAPLLAGLAAPLVRGRRVRLLAPVPRTVVVPDSRDASPVEERRAA